MTAPGVILAAIHAQYPATAHMDPLEAIDYVRRDRIARAEWNRSLDRGPAGRNEQDRAYADLRG